MWRERKIYASMEKKLPFLIGFGGFYQFPFFKKSLFTPCKVEEPLKDIQFWEKEEEKDEKHLRKLTRKNPKITDAFNSKLQPIPIVDQRKSFSLQ